MVLKIMSYNTQHCLNYVTQEIDYSLIADTIKNYGADIIGLNEIRGDGERNDYQPQTEILSGLTGFNGYFAKALDVGGANPYGNAILSRYPILSAETIMIPDPEKEPDNDTYETRCILKATIDVGFPLTVCVTHFGLNPDEQENAVNTVINAIETDKCILMGDFNVTPDNPVLDKIKEKMQDTAEMLPCPKLSFPSDNPTVKIDYIFTSRDIKVIDADIPEIVTSDHRPHIATIET